MNGGVVLVDHGRVLVLVVVDPCECRHAQDDHDDDADTAHGCLVPSCRCVVYRRLPDPELPAGRAYPRGWER